MRYPTFALAAVVLSLGTAAQAATIRFGTDPFAGSTALATPGRQVVAGEISVSFSTGTDVFSFDPAVFNAGSQVLFANNVVGSLPTSGANVIVLQTTDDDANAATPFGAGNAANLIASRVTSPGAGFFIYFNSALNLPRLVYSTDLDDNTSDLKILARMTNLVGQTSALPTFTSANFEIVPVPEPTSLVLLSSGLALLARRRMRRG